MANEQYAVNVVTTNGDWKTETKAFNSLADAQAWLGSQQAAQTIIYKADKKPRFVKYLEATAQGGSWTENKTLAENKKQEEPVAPVKKASKAKAEDSSIEEGSN